MLIIKIMITSNLPTYCTMIMLTATYYVGAIIIPVSQMRNQDTAVLK